MSEELKEEIDRLTQKLHSEEKHLLAGAIEQYWNWTLFDYSKNILTYTPNIPMETELREAFYEELTAQGRSIETITSVLNDLTRHRIIQTAPHSQLAQTPRMFCIEWKRN